MLTLRCRPCIAVTFLLLGTPSGVRAQDISAYLSWSGDELERLIYARAEQIRTGRQLTPRHLVQVTARTATASASSASRLSVQQEHIRQRTPPSVHASTSLRAEAAAIADAVGIPRHLAFALITVESNWHPRAVSEKGAVGLTQVLPSTAKSMNITCDLFEPSCNLLAGFTYLRSMLDIFADARLALAGYNGGPAVFSRRYAASTRSGVESYVRNVIAAANR